MGSEMCIRDRSNIGLLHMNDKFPVAPQLMQHYTLVAQHGKITHESRFHAISRVLNASFMMLLDSGRHSRVNHVCFNINIMCSISRVLNACFMMLLDLGRRSRVNHSCFFNIL